MKTMKRRIESLMADDGVSCFPSLGWWLGVLSLCYGVVSAIRAVLYERGLIRKRRVDCHIISVGNLAAGGTGKTPMTIYLAEFLKNIGRKPVVVSRGYKGSAEKSGGIVSDGVHVLMDAAAAGDEPYLMSKVLKNVPVLVGRDRYKSCRMAVEAFQPDVILLDDAFQHLKLLRDIDIVLLDASKPLGNKKLLPRGILREPPRALKRADVVIATRSDSKVLIWPKELDAMTRGKPVFVTDHKPHVSRMQAGMQRPGTSNAVPVDPPDMDVLNKKKVYVFSGIARNREFRAMLRACGLIEVGCSEFPDHHAYSKNDLEAVCRDAQKTGADLLVTTEKDFVRIQRPISWPVDLVVIGVGITFKEKASLFETYIRKRLHDTSTAGYPG